MIPLLQDATALTVETSVTNRPTAVLQNGDHPVVHFPMGSAPSRISRGIRDYGMIGTIGVFLVVFGTASGGLLVNPVNINNFFLQNAYLFVLAPGMMFVMVTGRIDLSVGSVAGLSSALCGVLMVRHDIDPVITVLLVLIGGASIGAIHGALIAYVRMPMFVVTLAGMLAWRGLTLVVLDGSTITLFPSSFVRFTAGHVLSRPASIVGFTPDALVAAAAVAVIFALYLRKARRNSRPVGNAFRKRRVPVPRLAAVLMLVTALLLQLGRYRGIPTVLLYAAAIIALYWFASTRTVVGRRVYAVGRNQLAARLSGLNPQRLVTLVYANSGLLAAVAGVLVAGRLNSATAKAGSLFEIEAIAACLAGGVSVAGGLGTMSGVLFGSLAMGILNNGMSLVGIEYQDAIKAGFLLLVGYVDVRTRHQMIEE